MSLLCARPGPMLLCRIVLFFVPCVGQSGWLYLRTLPDPVCEGDILILQCQGWKNTALSQVQFYKDRKLLRNPKAKWILHMGTATLESSGQYSCTGKVTFTLHLGTQRSKMTMVQVQELFPPPVLSAVPSPELREGSPLTLRCQTELHPQRSASRLLFSFHKDGRTLQNWGPHSELCLPEAREGASGLYWCQATPEGSRVQKQSPHLEVRVQAPVSQPLLTLRPRSTGLAVGNVVELLCETQNGSPPILYSFYLDEKILGNHSVPHGGAASFPFTVMSEQDAGSYSCQAENNVSKETSLWGLPTLTSSPWFVPCLSVSLLGVLVIATALVAYFRPWRKTGPIPTQNLPPAPGGEQHPLYGNVTWPNENEEDDIYSSMIIVPKKSEAGPAESASGTWVSWTPALPSPSVLHLPPHPDLTLPQDTSVIYTEVKHSKLGEVPAREPNTRSRTHRVALGNFEEVLYY
ncbi:Fc receptor-like protein 6 isoform X2 [Callorhinus ursinus]|uniref:Fc receptor-like protein 6 isoform X3 n=1 Tax=Callorhinus ursinus TaxID=34884 RepID=A0A3Q7NCM9_CALUR|nr:Fc receptor-like protein 6 isoform X3 [Callorhinus ursinus]